MKYLSYFGCFKKVLVTRESPISTEPNTTPMGAMIRARRRQLNMTLHEVCQSAEISGGYLSQIERDFAVPTITTLSRISSALGVGLDFFIARPKPTDCVTRSDRRQRFALGGSEILYERLGAEFAGHELSSFIMTIPPGYRSERVTHDGEETFFVIKGCLDLALDDDEITLEAGDSAHYKASRVHGWSNPGPEPAQVLWTGTIDLFRDPIGNHQTRKVTEPEQT